MSNVSELFFCFFISFLTIICDTGIKERKTDKYPSVDLQNDFLKVTVLLPDSLKGYYRSTRFDWSGIIAQVEYDGHTYFQDWEDYNGNEPGPHNPLSSGTATGTAEEFRNPLGYEEANVGEPFLKIGVGILEKATDEPYHWANPYKFLEVGKWETKCLERKIIFTQEITTGFGYAYQYEKVILLDSDAPELSIIHTLKNTGEKEIRSNPYCHNFFRFDGQYINSGYELIFPTQVRPLEKFDDRFQIMGNSIQYVSDKLDTLWAGGHIAPEGLRTYILANNNTNTSVKVISDVSQEPFYIGAWKWAFCPEPMIQLDIMPGASFTWKRTYRFKMNLIDK